jgi:hypothetical protein
MLWCDEQVIPAEDAEFFVAVVVQRHGTSGDSRMPTDATVLLTADHREAQRCVNHAAKKHHSARTAISPAALRSWKIVTAQPASTSETPPPITARSGPPANQFEEVRKAYQGALVDHWAIVSWAHRADNTEAVDV